MVNFTQDPFTSNSKADEALVRLLSSRLIALNQQASQQRHQQEENRARDEAENTDNNNYNQLFRLMITAMHQAYIGERALVKIPPDGLLSIAQLDNSCRPEETPLVIDFEKLRKQFSAVIGEPESHCPVVMVDAYVIFRQQWVTLLSFVNALIARQEALTPPSMENWQSMSWQLGQKARLNEQQIQAVWTMATSKLCFISGGAGTGKTTTLTKGLELLLKENPHYRVMLTAPTGKAAHRLNESIGKTLTNVDDDIREKLQSITATSLHRALKINETQGKPFHDKQNPLMCDVLVIDEASMVGLTQFMQVFQALIPSCRVILLGDANQLPAINDVSLFNELSQQPVYATQAMSTLSANYLSTPIPVGSSVLTNSLCRLEASNRFAEQSLVGQCASAILAHDAEQLAQYLGSSFYSITPNMAAADCYEALFRVYPREKNALRLALAQRMIVCSHRKGPYGTETINQQLDAYCRQHLAPHLPSSDDWYAGRRILIEKNHYALNLYNGDIGCCEWLDNQWVIVFDENRQIPVDDLPDAYALAFAITIHKSQGSEYDEVDLLIHPSFGKAQYDSFISKQMLYTAVTRAKHSLRLFAHWESIEKVLKQTHEPTSEWLDLLKCVWAQQVGQNR